MLDDIRNARHLLDDILVGDVDPEAPGFVASLIAKQFKEGVYLDYKSGDWIERTKAKKAELRAWVSSFANADGGILVVGIVGPDAADDQRPAWVVEGCSSVGQDLKTWASNVLSVESPYYSSPPLVYVADHGQHKLLVVACRRSDRLIPVVREGRPCYYIRIGDTTCRVPEYLLADLLLGRRRRPVVVMEAFDKDVWSRESDDMRLILSNRSIVHADDVRCGVVRPDGFGQPVFPELVQEVDIRTAATHQSIRVGALGKVASSSIEPFNGATARIDRIRPTNSPIWRAAAYVVAREMAPAWYQLTLDTSVNAPSLSCERVRGRRPVVGDCDE